MTPKQRFEQRVDTHVHAEYKGENYAMIEADVAVQLLLAEHRRVRALVREQTRYSADVNSSMTTQLDGGWINRDDLLDALAGQKEQP